MPASGLVPPLRTLVAVRAIAPVAAKPPNSGAAMFAMPWPISSWFESWRVPAMPSATTADSSDSIAPSIAIVNAGPSSSMTRASVTSGSCERGQRPRDAAERAADGGDAVEAEHRLHDRSRPACATSGPGTRLRPGSLGA